jgi:UDP-glucose 4-epimerase
MEMQKWLITGGAGYIGSAVANALHGRNIPIQVLDNLSNGDQKFLSENLIFLKGDIRNEEILRGAVRGCYGVIHMAANKSVSQSLLAPAENISDNLGPLLSLLNVMREEGVNNLIFSSSAAVYGDANTGNRPISENEPCNPTNAYGASKKWSEEAIIFESASRVNLGLNPLKFIALRYFNVIGPYGVSQDFSKSGLFSAIKRFYATGQPLQIFGNQFDTKDGTAVRDYISIHDVVNAHIQVISKWKDSHIFRPIYNVSTNYPNTVLEVINEFENQTSKRIRIDFLPPREGEIPFSIGNNSAFKEDFDWKTTKNLSQIVGETLKTY